MPSPLALSHIEAERRLRLLVTGNVERIWRDLPGYDRENLDEWLTKVVPLVDAGKRASAFLTEGYLARAIERPARGLTEAALDTRNGTSPEVAYERPFVTVWTALGAGSVFRDAVNSGLARSLEMARFDVQAAMRNTAQAVQDAEGLYGYQRVADGSACNYCAEIDGAYVKSADAFPLHPGCGCGLEPLTSPHSRAPSLPDGTAVHRHGEMGAVLGSSEHSFSGPAVLT